MNSPHRRNPYFTPYLLAAVGIGLCGWYGQKLYELPQYSDADIEASTEVNLAVDLARLGPQLQPDAAGIDRLRAQIRGELRAQAQQQRDDTEQGLGAGLVCLVLAAGGGMLARFNRSGSGQ